MSQVNTLAEVKQGAMKKSAAEVQAMRPKDQIAYFLDQKKGDIAKMLPAHLNPERLMKVAQIAATTTPALLNCDVPSLVGAIGQCAQMGLEPNTVLGHAYLVPFNTKRKDANGNERWVNSVQVIIGYKGLIDLARRSGQIVSIAAHEVCERDKFELVYGLDEKLNHTPSLGERGAVIGFYAVAKLKDGGHCCEFMSLHQVQEIMRGTKSKGGYGPWKDNFVEMGRKTVIRRLAKYLPLSIEFQQAAALDGMAEVGRDQGMGTIDADFLLLPDDAPVVDPETGEVAGQLSGTAQVSMPQGTGRRDPAEFNDQDQQNSSAPAAGGTTGAAAGPAGETSQQGEQGQEQAGGAGDAGLSYAKVRESMENAKDVDVLDVAADLIGELPADQQQELRDIYKDLRNKLENPPQPAAGRRTAAAKNHTHYPAE
ncbi:recombinase RecT [Herbaspirillum sp. WKF16]|uniref:recombinase RecT n=1 Tax=Herbaspirillum sp. WKF16 TaxID=3028312 RepID=UPI0023A9721A|nr:recombinase RecT [Herbaspirillum sp. WKF16]WDZ97942.1 recombinase RecT [Herbaspirillum sp. WKF16]